MGLKKISISGVDEEKLNKTLFVLKSKGKSLSQAVREEIDRYVEEYDVMKLYSK